MTPTPQHILTLPPDMREAYRAIRNAGAFCEESARPIPPLASCVLGWRRTRLEEAVDMLLGARYIRATPDGRVYVSEGARPLNPQTRLVAVASEYTSWSAEFKTLWRLLTFPEQRHLIGLRWQWRAWPAIDGNVPRTKYRRSEYRRAHDALYRLEYRFRDARPHCRGCDEVSLPSPHGRKSKE